MSSVPRRRLRAALATGTALAVAATTVLTVGGAASAAALTPPATADDRPAAAGAAWVAGQLDDDGVLHNEQFEFDDIGLTIDAGLALAAVGGQGEALDQLGQGVAAGVGSYIQFGSDQYAGATAKAAALAQTLGADPRTYAEADVDLVERLESLVLTEGQVAGRIADKFDPDSPWGADYANTIGQVFASRVLSGAGSDLADEVTGFLLDQQCDAGFFRLDFADKEAEGQSCDDAPPTSTPGADVTALVVVQLSEIEAPTADVTAALQRARTWLLAQQRPDGAFTNPDGVNSNTTGLGGWALGVLGEDAAAARAAGSVRGLQAADLAPCADALTADAGVIAFDDAALSAARTDGIETTSQDQFRRATTQALPALLWAPKGATVRLGAKEWGRAGTNHRVAVRGLAPGETVCVRSKVSRSLEVAGFRGGLRSSVRLPRGAGVRVIEVKDSTQAHRTTVKAVVPKELGVRVAKRPLKAGAVQRIVVRGLAGGEPAQVFVRGRRVARGEAGARGRFVARVRLPKAGPAKVRATGVLPKVRVGRAAFRVVR